MTGVGESIMRAGLARAVSAALQSDRDATVDSVCEAAIREDILEGQPFAAACPHKDCGILAVRVDAPSAPVTCPNHFQPRMQGTHAKSRMHAMAVSSGANRGPCEGMCASRSLLLQQDASQNFLISRKRALQAMGVLRKETGSGNAGRA